MLGPHGPETDAADDPHGKAACGDGMGRCDVGEWEDERTKGQEKDGPKAAENRENG